MNYSQSYNDPAMAGLGGFSGIVFVGSQKLSIQEPYGLVIAVIPLFIVISFLSDDNISRKLFYSGFSIIFVLAGAAAIFFGLAPGWVAVSVTVIVFCILWVILFRWRYVHNQND